ncbi:MAG: NAD(P)-binding protein [Eubacteriales bacterium]|nr:NAD(P)-binding protein [Eubacteriales bacterium]
MSRLDIMTPSRAQTVIDGLYRDVERRIAASPPGLCPVDLAMNFLNLCHAQTCGKCVPCRIGLGQLSALMESVLDGTATMETLAIIERTARVIVNSADCAIGRDAARLVLDGLAGFRDDYEEHIMHHRCLGGMQNPVPCVALCPAGVDIPGYLVLVKYGRYADAVRLIRKDNPFPSACAYICEHPCEARCRRNMIDDAVNIRGLKRYAVDHAGIVPNHACAEATGKTVAVIGGGPGGLSAAYYLALMGHKVSVYEKRRKLGGMLRYGIPAYRLPREVLDEEIRSILSVGIEVHTDVNIGEEITFDELKSQYDALYIAIGAHTDKKTGIEGEDSEGVVSAVELLREIGDDNKPDFTGKEIVVIGGGNVAMDVCRSSIRLGAKKVSCVYRRRQSDMTALPEEVEGAVAEGVELVTLEAPVRIETDEKNKAVALWSQPQVIGEMDSAGRPRPKKADCAQRRIAADVIVVAIGQGIETHGFEQSKISVKRGTFVAQTSGQIGDMDGVFAGGDCVTGPATVIRAIAAGKVAAANIDEYLGYHHEINVGVEIPTPRLNNKPPHGRINTTEREACERKHDFQCIECGLTDEEAHEEASRCLRCDHFGYGVFRGGRKGTW